MTAEFDAASAATAKDKMPIHTGCSGLRANMALLPLSFPSLFPLVGNVFACLSRSLWAPVAEA